MQRKFRHKILDSQGQVKSLENSLLAYAKIYSQSYNQSSQEIVILLGLGVEPQIISEHLNSPIIYYLENPEFSKQMPNEFITNLTNNFIKLEQSELLEFIKQIEIQKQNYSIWQYQANAKLFPNFWLDILSQLKTRQISQKLQEQSNSQIIALAATKHDLLTYELSEACTQNGLTAFLINPKNAEIEILELAKHNKPICFLSVNLRGLNPASHSLLKALGIAIVIWFVDNPFNIISKRSDWQDYQDCFICLSARYFVQALQKTVKKLYYLPLASSMSLAKIDNKLNQNLNLLFVGRTCFPAFESFFRNAQKFPKLLEQAQQIIVQQATKEVPDFAWWQDKLQEFKPKDRDISYNTELTNLEWRKFWLNSLAEHNLTVVGDQAWSRLLSKKIQLKEAVDYYNGLFALYKSANFTLNITSLLLPEALTQRHFDVWLAGGFLLTNYTADLQIFELKAEHYAAKNPQELIELMHYYQKNPKLKSDIQKAMQKEIQNKHLYKHRIAQILLMLKDKKSTQNN